MNLPEPPRTAVPAPPDETQGHHPTDPVTALPIPAGEPPTAAHVPNQDIPARVGRYEIRQLLGRGGMGAVYLAHDPELDRLVALKVPRLAGPEAEERFLREARAAAAVSHPHLCPVYDAGRADGGAYLTMAYFPGPTLTQVLRESGPLPPARAATLAAGIARGMAEAHRHGIVHRDLKPGNVILDRRGEPVVTDFGLARRSGSRDVAVSSATTVAHDPRLTQAGVMMGTPAYMPPEQARGEVEKVGPASDVYALGAILFELLTGQAPFAADTIPELVRKIEAEPPPAAAAVRPGLPAGLDAVIRRALAKDPADRFPSMEAFADALTPFAAARRRRWAGVALAAAFAALALAVGVVIYVQTDNGTVEVRLNDPSANVEVAVDGTDIMVTDGKRVTKLRAGPHTLVVKGQDFETETKLFKVTRGDKTVVEIELKPKARTAPPAVPAKLADTERAKLARLLARGEHLVKVGHFLDLADVAAEALKIDPESPGALALRATCLLERGHMAAARADAEAALKLNPETFQALVIHSVSEGVGFDEGIADLTIAIRLRPDNPIPYSNRALAYLGKREYRQAEADATKAITAGDLRSSPWQTRAAARAYLGEYDKALGDYAKAIDIAPNDPRNFIQRSALYHRMGDEPKADADWETARKLVKQELRLADRPEFPVPPKPPERKKLTPAEQAVFDAAFAAAQKAWDQNRFAECDTALEKVVNTDPTSAPARSLRSRLWIKLGRTDEARTEVAEVIRLDPKDPWAYVTRGVLADAEKHPAAAIADYNIALGIAHKNQVIWNNRGWAYFKLGQYGQAIADIDEAIRLKPDYSFAYSNRGACQLYLGRYEQAEADYSKRIESEPQNTQWLLIRSAIRVRRENLNGAAADRQAAIDIDRRLADAPGFTLPVPLTPKLDPEAEAGAKPAP